MILRLMRKDLMLNWHMVTLVVAGLVLLLVFLNFAVAGEDDATLPVVLLVFVCTCYPALLTTLFAGLDDRHRTGSFDLALPVRRLQVLLSRYLLAILLHPVWLVVIAVSCWAWQWPRFPSALFTPESLALSFAALVCGMGPWYPLVLRAGFMGMLYGLVGLQVVGVAVTALARSWSPFERVVDLVRRIGPGLRTLHARLGDPWYLAGVFVVLSALYALSFLVAAALYRRKEM